MQIKNKQEDNKNQFGSLDLSDQATSTCKLKRFFY